MKHILNNLSDEEKNSILEQHTGGMKVINKNFSKLLNAKLGDAKPLVNEQSSNPKNEFINLEKKLKIKYKDICKYDTIKTYEGGKKVVKLNTGGKIYPFDSEVKRFQQLQNELSPEDNLKVDGIIGPEMKKYFCTIN
jgi:hypothetical protein